MKTITLYEIGLIVVGMLLCGTGWKLDISLLIQIGLMVCGVGLMAVGLNSIINGRTSFPSSSESGRITYHHTCIGIGPIAWRSFSILLGLLTFIEGLLYLIGSLPDI